MRTTQPSHGRGGWCGAQIQNQQINPRQAAEGETGARRKTKTWERACISCSGAQRLRTAATAGVGSVMASASTQFLRRVAPASESSNTMPGQSNSFTCTAYSRRGSGYGREGGRGCSRRQACMRDIYCKSTQEPSKSLTSTHDLWVPSNNSRDNQLCCWLTFSFGPFLFFSGCYTCGRRQDGRGRVRSG